MFGDIPQGSRALLWMAIIMAAGFTAIIYCAVIPLVKALREQNQFIQKLSDKEPLSHKKSDFE